MNIAEGKSEGVVELRNISVAYKKPWSSEKVLALDNISLDIYKGETVGFVGNNGAGKSTTLRIILGLQKPSSGTACLNGLSVHDHEARTGVSYVPESAYLYDYLTPLELLKHGAKMHQCHDASNEAALESRCMLWLERFRIAHVARKRIKTFSKGMLQRTALAHALACEPTFLILDEPLSGLDPIGRQEVVNILDDYRASGRTLFFSSHVLTDVERLADRFVFLDKGKIQAVCTTKTLFEGEEPSYLVSVEGEDRLDGFEKVSARLSQKKVLERDLSMSIAHIVGLQGKSDISLYAVKNLNSLEQAYYSFVESTRGRDDVR